MTHLYTGLSIADLIVDALGMDGVVGSTPTLDVVSTAISLVVNMIATTLIGWKAW